MSNVIFIQYINPFKVNGDYNPKLSSDTPTKPGSTPANPNTTATSNSSSSSNSEVETIVAPLLEDFNLSIDTSFEAASSLIPQGIANILNLVKTLQTLGGQRGETSITDLMDVPLWQSTKPISFNVKLGFYVESDPYNDVWRPIVGLASLAMLTPTDDPNVFYLPGINFANLGLTFASANQQKSLREQTLAPGTKIKSFIKLISVEIPGIVYLPFAMIDKPQIQFSQEQTDTGWPLWGTIELPVQGIIPASSEQFRSMPVKIAGTTGAGGLIKSSGHFTDQLLDSINANKAEENFSFRSDNP